MYCEQCRTVHPGVRGGPEESMLYSVMLLKGPEKLSGPEKSFFCNPGCYELYRKTSKTYAPEKFADREERLARTWHMRENWKERSAEARRALGYAK